MQKIICYLAIACIISGGFYATVIAPRLTIRVPDDWSFEAEYLGDLVYIDPDQEVPPKPLVNVYSRSMRVVEWNRKQAVIEDIFETRDILTGAITWSTKLYFNVDPATGAILSYPGHPEATGAQYLMPRRTRKTSYPLFNYTLGLQALEFVREETINGLDVYVFSYRGMVDFTELTKMAEMPGGLGTASESIRIRSFDYYSEMWIEPRSGEIVHMADIDPGDYLVDAKSDKPLQLASIWSGSTTGNSDRKLVERAKSLLLLLDIHYRWVPGILLGAGFLLLTIIVLRTRFEKAGG